MPNITIAARLIDDAEWTGIEVARRDACQHLDTICATCWRDWSTDWEFMDQDVPGAIGEVLVFAGDVTLVQSLAATTPLASIMAGMRDNGRSEAHVAEVLYEVARMVEAPASADQPGTERLSVWTLTRMNPVSTVQEGDYHEMYVVAQSAEAARSWAYRRAVLDNKPEPSVWRDGDEFALRVLHFYEVDDDAETGVVLAETWTVDKMGSVPFRRR